jgi:benzoate/toluate 1,2-dioxygenase alpha subunit
MPATRRSRARLWNETWWRQMNGIIPNRRDYSAYVDDRPQDGVFRVSREVYNDPDILEAEYRHIFESNWVFLCHEAHVPNPGDYFSTHIGRQPVFVVRKPGGGLAAYLNACGHRGATLVTARTGNKSEFVCPYHGFCFNADGKCTAVQSQKNGWKDETFDINQYNLKPLARLDSYRGLIFGSLAVDVPDLKDHLGAATRLIDIFVAPAPQDLEIVAGFSIYVMNCNWKIMHENGPDAYHVPAVHANFAAAVKYREQRTPHASGVAKTDTARVTGRIESASYDLGNGHTAFWHKRMDPGAFPIYAQKPALEKQFSPKQLEWILGRGRHMTIFPNLLLNDLASTHLRTYRPLSVDRMETMIWCIAPKGEPADMRAARLRKFEDFFLPSGMATPDDIAIAEAAQRASWALDNKWTVMTRGIEFKIDGPDVAARDLGMTPDASSNSWDHEIAMHGVYRRWVKMMEHGEEQHRV